MSPQAMPLPEAPDALGVNPYRVREMVLAGDLELWHLTGARPLIVARKRWPAKTLTARAATVRYLPKEKAPDRALRGRGPQVRRGEGLKLARRDDL